MALESLEKVMSLCPAEGKAGLRAVWRLGLEGEKKNCELAESEVVWRCRDVGLSKHSPSLFIAISIIVSGFSSPLSAIAFVMHTYRACFSLQFVPYLYIQACMRFVYIMYNDNNHTVFFFLTVNSSPNSSSIIVNKANITKTLSVSNVLSSKENQT